MTLADEILALDDGASEVVEVPEWGGRKIEVRSTDLNQRSRFLAMQLEANEREGDDKAEALAVMQVALVVATAFDPESGELVFTEGHVEQLRKKNSRAIGRLYEKAMVLCGLSDDAEAEMGKDSSTTASGDTASS